MTDNTVPLPLAGWFPDPDIPGQHRWWDGTQWHASQLAVRPRLGAGFGVLRNWVVALLFVHAGINLVLITTYAWGLTLDGYSTWAEGPVAFVVLSTVVEVSLVPLFMALVALWCMWQFRLAQVCRPGAIRRSPGMNIGSWFIPIVFFWFPLQNMRDLWKVHVGRTAGGLLGIWWFGWLVANRLTNGITSRVLFHEDELTFHAYNVMSLVEATVWLFTTLVAVVIVVRLSRSALDREGAPTD